MSLFKNLKLSSKMYLSFGLIMILSLIIMLISLNTLDKVGNLSNEMYNKSFKVSVKSMAVISEFNNINSKIEGIMLRRSTNELEESIDESVNNIKICLEEIKPIYLGDTQIISDFETKFNELSAERKNIIDLMKNNQYDLALQKLTNEYTDYFNAAEKLAKQIHIESLNRASDFDVNALQTAKVSKYYLICLFIILILFSLAAAFFTSKAISKPVITLKEIANEIASGDLDVSLNNTSKDEIGELSLALNNIVSSFNDALFKINESAEQVSNGSKQVAEGAQSLAEGATEQASVVEQLVASVSEISSKVDNNAENAQKASEISLTTNSMIQSGSEQMKEVVKAMDTINKNTSQIRVIVKTIEDIASQTKLLSLNASIEAARVGEMGAGFGVVANEIGKLAYESSEATKSTTELIQKCIEASEVGTSTVEKAVDILHNIIDGANEAVGAISSIKVASREQSESLKQIVQGVEQVSTVMQSSSAISEESAATSQELSGQAEILKSLVGRFKLKEI